MGRLRIKLVTFFVKEMQNLSDSVFFSGLLFDYVRATDAHRSCLP